MPLSLTDRIEAVLNSDSPELIHARDHRYLARRITVLLDGVDVTPVCLAFNAPTGTVVLRVEEDGRTLLEWTCGCGSFRGNAPGRICLFCGQEFEPSVAKDLRTGRVEVVRK